MCNAARYTLLLFLVIGSSCTPPSPPTVVASRQRSGALESDAFPRFWQSFQAALKTNDESAIIGMTRFPLEGGLETSADFAGVNTQEGFKRHFGMLFPEDAILTLLSTTPDLDGSHSDTHDVPMVWSISPTSTSTLSDGDWTDSAIIYRFTCLSDGLIKLTSITIAG